MGDAVDEVGWDGPCAAFLFRENDVGKSFEIMKDYVLHAAVLVGVVDEIVGEEAVGHVVRELVGDAFFSEHLKVFNTALNKMSSGHP